MNRLLIDMWTLHVLLVRTWMERRNILLETRGKRILVILWQSISELCPAVMWKVELVNYKFEYLDKEISKQIVEVVTCYFLTGYSKMGEEKIN